MSWLVGEALDLNAAIGAEIDQKTEFYASGLEVVKDLGPVFLGDGGDGLEFHDDFIETNEVGTKV